MQVAHVPAYPQERKGELVADAAGFAEGVFPRAATYSRKHVRKHVDRCWPRRDGNQPPHWPTATLNTYGHLFGNTDMAVASAIEAAMGTTREQ